MKKITLLVCVMLSAAGFAQDTCATAIVATSGPTYEITAIDGTDLPLEDCTQNEDTEVTAAEWYAYTPTFTGVAIISANKPENSLDGDDTRVSVYTGTCGALVCAGSADDVNYPTNVTSELILPVISGTTYYIAWDNQWEEFWTEPGFFWDILELPVDCTTSMPFSSTFEDPNAFAACYTVIDGDANGTAWIQQALDLDEDGTDETFATNGSNGAVVKDDWLFTPAIALEAGEAYTITYTYNGANGQTQGGQVIPANETLQAVVANSPLPTATFLETLGAADSGIVQTGGFADLIANATTQSKEFVAPTTGDYYIGFHTTSPANSAFLLLFEYTIDVSLAAPHFEAGKISMYPNPVVNELNVANENVIDSVEVYNLMGQKVLGQTFNTNEVKVNMEQLSSGAYMVKVFSGNASSIMKVIKQ